MSPSVVFRQCSRTFPRHLLACLTAVRSMGGGPRTFPGGLNKWQWKRLHEKKAREKEKRLLEQEKQLYQARLRSQIRAKIATAGQPEQGYSSSSHKPMTPKDHIKALADRFVKAGAEDLWNENDGPIRIPPKPSPVKTIDLPVDLKKFVLDGRNMADARKVLTSMKYDGNWQHKRDYSIDMHSRPKATCNYRRNGSSSSDDESYRMVSGNTGKARCLRFNWEGDENIEEERDGRVRRNVRRFMRGAALGKCDVKTLKRLVLKQLGENGDEEDERIRQEVNEQKHTQNLFEESEESLISGKRFEDRDITSLTLKGLASAGCLQIARVQEATLSICLEEVASSFCFLGHAIRSSFPTCYGITQLIRRSHFTRSYDQGQFCQKCVHHLARSMDEYSVIQSSSLQHWFKNWQELRKNKLTASTFGGAVGFWPRRRVQLWLEKLGAIEPFSGNLATCWNNISEEKALERYKLVTGNTVLFPEFQVHGKNNPEDDWLAASPDGIVENLVFGLPSRGILEVKCPFFDGDAGNCSPWKRIPLYYMPQAQGLMEIMDKDWMDFYVWTPVGSSLFRIDRDVDYWYILKIALSDFWWKHVQPAKELSTRLSIKNPLIELRSVKPEPRHKDCSLIVYESKRLVDNSKLLIREIHGKLQN